MRSFDIIWLLTISLTMTMSGCQQPEAGPDTIAASLAPGGSPGAAAPGLWSTPVRTVDARAAAEAADLDGDGDEDIVVVGKLAATTTDVTVLTNDGTGRYSPKAVHTFPSVTSQHADNVCVLALTDGDRDGDVDIVFGDVGRSGDPLRLRLLKNDGKGSFSF